MWLLVPGPVLAHINDDQIARAFVRQYDYVYLVRVTDFKAAKVEVITLNGVPPPSDDLCVRLAMLRLLKDEGKDVRFDKNIDTRKEIDKEREERMERLRKVNSAGLLFGGVVMKDPTNHRFKVYNVRKDGRLAGEDQVRIDALLRMGGNRKVVYHRGEVDEQAE
jgi:hypothetical protein